MEIQDSTPGGQVSRTAILMKYLQSCRTSIEHSKAAREYAESRKLNVARLGIGFNGTRMFDTWSGILKENAAKTGLLNKSVNGSYTARFKNCLVFEIKDKVFVIVSRQKPRQAAQPIFMGLFVVRYACHCSIG